MPALTCGGCRSAIRKGARSRRVRCEAGHISHLHRRCLKASTHCPTCGEPLAFLIAADGSESSTMIKRVRTKARNDALARALWSEFESGRVSAEVPAYVNPAQLDAIKKRMRSFNFRSDKWQDAPDRADGAKLDAFLSAIKRV